MFEAHVYPIYTKFTRDIRIHTYTYTQNVYTHMHREYTQNVHRIYACTQNVYIHLNTSHPHPHIIHTHTLHALHTLNALARSPYGYSCPRHADLITVILNIQTYTYNA